MDNNEFLYKQAIQKYEKKKLEYDVAKIFYLNIPYLMFINIIAIALTLVMVGLVLFNVISLINPNQYFDLFGFIINSWLPMLLLACMIGGISSIIYDYLIQKMKIDDRYLGKVLSKINKKFYASFSLNCDFIILNTKQSNYNDSKLDVKEAVNHFLNLLCDNSSEYQLISYEEIKKIKTKI